MTTPQAPLPGKPIFTWKAATSIAAVPILAAPLAGRPRRRPYRMVLTHGFMMDADREKISKSKQTGYEKPQTAEAYGPSRGGRGAVWWRRRITATILLSADERISKVAKRTGTCATRCVISCPTSTISFPRATPWRMRP